LVGIYGHRGRYGGRRSVFSPRDVAGPGSGVAFQDVPVALSAALMAFVPRSMRIVRSATGAVGWAASMSALDVFVLLSPYILLTSFSRRTHARSRYWDGAMGKLVSVACLTVVAAALVGAAGAAPPEVGTLSVEGGNGVVYLGLRGSVLGRLADGTLTVVDLTPRDAYVAVVTGRKLVQHRLGPYKTRYRGVGLRYRMLGGGYRIVLHGEGIDISAVGRGVVELQAERTLPTDDAGVYSLAGVDCGAEPASCTPLPDLPQRFKLSPPSVTPSP
jgi:hypothetical protein